MARPRYATERILALLAATPGRLAALTDGVPAVVLDTGPAPGEWSAVEVLAHLRACADVWGGHIATILAAEQPTIRAINPTTWIHQTDYPALAFAPSLAVFTAQRQGLLEVLTTLPAADWDRAATLVGAGKPLPRTVHGYADALARHEQPHLKQLARAIAAVRTGGGDQAGTG